MAMLTAKDAKEKTISCLIKDNKDKLDEIMALIEQMANLGETSVIVDGDLGFDVEKILQYLGYEIKYYWKGELETCKTHTSWLDPQLRKKTTIKWKIQ